MSNIYLGGKADFTDMESGIQHIYTGGIANNTVMSSGRRESEQYVNSGAVANNTAISSGCTQEVMLGGVARVTNIHFSGSQNVHGYAQNTTIYYSAAQYIFSGASAQKIEISGGVQYISSGGSVQETTILGNGSQYVSSGAIVSNTKLYSGNQTVYDGGVAKNTAIGKGGVQTLYGSAVGETFINSSGSVYVQSCGSLKDNITINSGGYLSLINGGNLEGNVALNIGGSMTIGLSNGGSVDLIGDTNRGLITSGYTAGMNASVTTVISGFSGLRGAALSDKILFDGLQAANVSTVTYPDDNHITLQLLDGSSLTLNMPGIKQTGSSLGSNINGDLTMVVCFLSGTLIKMAKGSSAVENIQIGDVIFTYDPQSKAKVKKKVTWVGKKTLV